MGSQANRKLLYAVVARGTTTLAEHSAVSGNVSIVATRLLEKMPTEDTRVSYTQDAHMFHVLVADGLTYMCMAEQTFGRRIPFAFLEDIRQRFVEEHGDAAQAVAYEYNTTFSRVLSERMTYFSSDPGADVINRVKGEILEVKSIMVDNIEKVLERGERLDVLVDKTEDLQEAGLGFRREARRLKVNMWWQNSRLWALVGGSVMLLIYIIWASLCGPLLRNCGHN